MKENRYTPIKERADEWNDRLIKLSNRLTRYWWLSGRAGDDRELTSLRIAEGRMSDLIFAAVSIGYCRLRIREAVEFLRAAGSPVDSLQALVEAPDQTDKDRITSTWHEGYERFREAYSDFHSLLWWCRALLSRVQDTWGKTKNRYLVGLAAYLPTEDSQRIFELRDTLRSGAFSEVKDLADYSLHAFVLPNNRIPWKFTEAGSVLPLPDRLPGPPDVAQAFTYDEDRDAARYADRLWNAAKAFVGDALGVLEAGQLGREDALPPEKHKGMASLRATLLPENARLTKSL